MQQKRLWIIYLAAFLFLQGGCSGHDKGGYSGVPYKPSEKVTPVYQSGQVPKSCRVTAHVLANLPPKFSGSSFAEAIMDEAAMRGSDMVLVGQSRQSEEGEELSFTYYGPAFEYTIGRWAGWNFGYEIWEDQGEWVSIGLKEWGNSNVEYDFPILMQLAFIRCR